MVEQDKSLKEMEKHKKDVQGKTIELREKSSMRSTIEEYVKCLSGYVFAFCIIFVTYQIMYKSNQQELPKQIKEVENAIKNLRNLESYLEKTKSDMIATEQAKIKIEEEYNKAKELEKLTENQIEAISLAVNKRTTTDIIKNYFWGFVLGVSGSLFASFIRGLLKRRKTQTKL